VKPGIVAKGIPFRVDRQVTQNVLALISAGASAISHVVRLTGKDTLESSGTNEFFAANGQSYRTGCSTATGQRFE
jgi:hypothetical protein